MHLTLTVTLNIQRFVSSQHKVWIVCLQEKAMGITQEKPCTHLRIYSTKFKIFILWFIFSSFIHPGTLKLCVSSAQTFTRHAETVATQGTLMRLWKMYWWAFLWPHAHHNMQDSPGRSFPLTPPFFGGSRRQGLKEWTGKLRYHFKESKKTPSKGQPVGMLPCVPVGEQCQSRAQKRCLTEF